MVQHSTDSSSTRTFTVQELTPFTEYSFSVAAVNSVGTGPFSETIRTAGMYIVVTDSEHSSCMHENVTVDTLIPIISQFTQLLAKLSH